MAVALEDGFDFFRLGYATLAIVWQTGQRDPPILIDSSGVPKRAWTGPVMPTL